MRKTLAFFTHLTQSSFYIPGATAFLFFLIYVTYSITKHLQFNSYAFDLGIYSQISYLYASSFPAYSTLHHMVLLGDHFGPILALFSPLTKILPSSIVLLLLQALMVSLSSIPIYLIAFTKLKSKILSFLIAVCYLTSTGILSAINFDFHLAAIATLPLSLLLYFWLTKKWRVYWITLAISILFKEDVEIYLLGLGMYQIFTGNRKVGIITSAFALISFYIIKFILMPIMAPGSQDAYIGTSILPVTSPILLIYLLFTNPGIFLKIFFDSPVKLNTFNTLYQQFGFLPLLSPFSWLTVFPELYLRFSSTYQQSWTLDYHHNSIAIPFLAVGTVLTLQKFKFTSSTVSLLLIMLLLLGGLSPNSLVWKTFTVTPFDISSYEYVYQGLNKVPTAAAVSAQGSIVPHLASRKEIYLYPDIYNAEYIVLDSALTTYPLSPEEFQKRLTNLKQSPTWKLLHQSKSFYIFKKM